MKKFLFILLVAAITSIAFTSCQQTETEELITPPLSAEYTPDERESQNDEEMSRSNCHFCQHLGSSYRSSGSRYVYCYGNDGHGKKYRLGVLEGGRIKHIRSKSTSHYNTYFDNLDLSKTYYYNVVNYCPNVTISHKKWTRIK